MRQIFRSRLWTVSFRGNCWFSLVFTAVAVGCGDSETNNPKNTDHSIGPASQTVSAGIPQAALPNWEELDVASRPPAVGDWFEDVTEHAGVKFSYRDGQQSGFYQLIESVGGGVAIFDYDKDGDVDLFFTGGGTIVGPPLRLGGLPCAFYRNEGNLQFKNVTEQAGLADSTLYTHGCTVGDFDRDGWQDLFVAGYGGCRLYRNETGQRFRDVTEEAELACPDWNVTACWLDFNNDGWLDLYVVTYADWKPDHTRVCINNLGKQDICSPKYFQGSRDRLWQNNKDGTFEDVSQQAGLVERNLGLGVVAADIDGNGYADIYVANDAGENILYLNDGTLPFSSKGTLYGVARSLAGGLEGSMGVDVGDFDGDSLPDLWYTNYAREDNSLLRLVAQRNGFVNVSDVTGITGKSRVWVGFGTGFADFDNDGWLDLFVSNGHAAYDYGDGPYFQPAQLFRNRNGIRYEEISERGGPYFSVPHAGRGAAVGDLNNDGAVDLVIVHQNQPVTLLRNRNVPTSWFSVHLRGTQSNPDAIGATVSFQYGGRLLTRLVRGGGGYLSHFDSRLVFPTIGERSNSVTVRWPSGHCEVFENLSLGTHHELVEAAGQPIENRHQ